MSTVQAVNPGPEGTRTFKLPNSMDTYTAHEDDRVFAPATSRNKEPILQVLQRYLTGPSSDSSKVVEVASGSGEHAAHFARALPSYTFQPTDCSSELFKSIIAHALQLSNIMPPMLLDASNPKAWEEVVNNEQVGSIICINMTHISPWEATMGLLDGAGRHLAHGGYLFIYGPFTIEGGKHTSSSNADFDASLRQRNPLWGYRDVDEIAKQAASRSLHQREVVAMPANNFMLIFQKDQAAA
eukprot:CAMPEP_0202902768 /NCGR_PEP_ID=MMETSP1392-20130828/17040_1 /ASSEMBLY_ACC=CAM_ASM_000868 /TAXON_ID=225041 /ORGANISM="Chlamydomonas chlamydogama, Strain SAG 11-48b" /LENGTH=240 /DNA_ID=CAMNT_0049589575 /DNA_START=109 /DNA_END=834 /DNA_ORIENTATION=-